MQLAFDKFLDSYKKFLVIYSKGKKGKGIRCVTNIEDKESIELVKTFINLGTQIRHVKKLASMNFEVGDKEVIATIEKMEGGKMVQSPLSTNEPMYNKHFYSIFEELCNKDIDARARIKVVEEGAVAESIDIVPNPKEGIKHAWEVIKSTKKRGTDIIFYSKCSPPPNRKGCTNVAEGSIRESSWEG